MTLPEELKQLADKWGKGFIFRGMLSLGTLVGLDEYLESFAAEVRHKTLEAAARAQCEFCRDPAYWSLESPDMTWKQWHHRSWAGIRGERGAELKGCNAHAIRALLPQPPVEEERHG